MPRREDLKSVLVIGSGPIVIGQGCEFDYSGTQACRVLKQEGIRVSLVNSNPATIMTDPEFADATYVEPITADTLEKVIAIQRPDAVLPTLGGQTALNAAVALHDSGVLQRYGVELIGANIDAIRAGEDRERFKEIVTGLGAEVPASRICRDLDECIEITQDLGYPVVIRPSFTLGGLGSGVAKNEADLRRIAGAGLDASPTHEVLLEQSILGWKEFELELMRDARDNVVVVCSIENIDPMGVHTGDSVTVAPAMTLTDREYQRMRDTAIAIMRAVGVDTGGCNIQFAVEPDTGRMVVIEMNPRVSRSSALASKATGFPIAKIAARLAIGYTLDEIPNDITGQTPACFEPALDYVVVKVPRFAFEKFPGADPALTTHMKSVGEAMAIGRNFAEALQKAQRSLESNHGPFGWKNPPGDAAALLRDCGTPHDGRLATIHQALRAGASPADLAAVTGIDPWFIEQIQHIEEVAQQVAAAPALDAATLRTAKESGFSDAQLADLRGTTETVVREMRWGLGVQPGVPRRGHLRGRVRGAHPVPLLHLRRADRGAGGERAQGDHPRQRAEPDRPGHRVRLRLRARLVRARRRRATRPSWSTATRRRSPPTTTPPAGCTSSRSPSRTCSRWSAPSRPSGPVAGRHRAARRADAARAGPRAGGRRGPGRGHLARRPSTWPRTAAPSRACSTTPGWPRRGTGPRPRPTEAVQIAQQIGYPVLVRPSYVLGGRGMEIVYDDAVLRVGT